MKLISFFMTILLSSSLYASTIQCHGGEAGKNETPRPGDKTQNYCDQNNESACAFLWIQSFINTSEEGKFIVKFNLPDQQQINELKADLWMDMGEGHGHGSAPVEVSKIDSNTFQIKNAWFLMIGEWQVRFDIKTQQNQTYHIVTPIYVEN